MPDALPDAGPIRFHKRRDAGSVLNATVALIRRNARELLTSYLAVVAPIAAVAGIASALAVGQMGALVTDPEAVLFDPFSVFGPAYVASLVLSVLTGAVAQAAAGGYVRLYRRGEAGAITPGALWSEAQGLVLPLAGLTLAFMLGVVLTGLLNILPCLGTVAWAVIVVWAVPVYGVAAVSRVVETTSVGDAWARARVLVKGSWPYAMGALLLAGVVAAVVSLVIGGLGGVLAAVLGVGVGFDPTGASAGFTVVGAGLQAVLQVLGAAVYLVPFLAAYFVHGRLADELDGTALRDDLDTLADAGFADAGFADAGFADAGRRPAPLVAPDRGR